MSGLEKLPAWYLVVAVVFSCYYAYRGYMGNWIAQQAENQKRTQALSKGTIISVFCVHDMLFHFFCSLAGFLGLAIAKTLYEGLDDRLQFDTGRSVLLVFAFLFGFVGATGQLPQLILQGKIPGFGAVK